MAAEPDWVIEFRLESNIFVRSTLANGKSLVVPQEEGKWSLLAEGTYKECRGHARIGFMLPRPLESCIKRVHKMMLRGGVFVRLRNTKTGEIIPGEVFV